MSVRYFGYTIFISLVLFGCQSSHNKGTQKDTVSKKINPTKEVIMQNLKRPWSMAFISQDEVLLAEKDGDLLKINLASKSKDIIRGFPSDLADSLLIIDSAYPKGTYPSRRDGSKIKYNAGIFEVVLDPNFSTNKLLYISYASEKNQKYATKVIRAKLEGEELVDIETILLALPYVDGLFHFGGGMVFGSDGKLYITVGERLFTDGMQPDVPIAQESELHKVLLKIQELEICGFQSTAHIKEMNLISYRVEQTTAGQLLLLEIIEEIMSLLKWIENSQILNGLGIKP